jgi:hypothetical protein
MFADPIIVLDVSPTAWTTASSSGAGSDVMTLACISRGPTSSVYRYSISSSHYIDLLIGRIVGKRSRYTFRVTETELVTDPINSELNSVKTATIYSVADIGVLGTSTNWEKMGSLIGALLLKKSDGTTALSRLIAGET